MKNWLKITGIVGVLAIAGAVVVGSVMAQEPTDPTQEREDFGGKRGFMQRGGPGGFSARLPQLEEVREETQAAIASVLGLSVEELEAALADGLKLKELAEQQGVEMEAIQEAVQAVHEAAIDQAVADGTITQEQADQLKERLANKPQNGFGPRRGGPGGGAKLPQLEEVREETQAAIAETLGLSVEELEASLADGVKLKELAEQQGVEMEAIQEAVQAVREAAIDQAVADGTITQEQADKLKEHLEDGCGNKRGFRGGRGFGGPRGGFGAPQGNFGSPVAPSVSGDDTL